MGATFDREKAKPEPAPEPLRSVWWSVHRWDGWPAQQVFTSPPATYAEMREIYPQAAGIIAADGAAKA